MISLTIWVSESGKGTSWQHGYAESHGQNCYPQLKILAVTDASVCNVSSSNEEGNWNNMSEGSSQEGKVQFFVMFTPRSEAQAQRASQELSTAPLFFFISFCFKRLKSF